jgi:diguanylate cyclase (GGDEF)-like protein
MLDLDHFKVINDTLGHQTGDAVLMAAARRLQRLARPDDTVARFGGDEFVVVVHGLRQTADLSAFADRVVVALREPYRIGKEEIVTTVSIGIAATTRPDHLPMDLLREADLALYQAKDRGRDRHEVYGDALQVRAVQRIATEKLVRRAIAEEQLVLEYQPIVDLATGKTVEAEALLRIEDPDRGRRMPEYFLSVAEEAGLLPAMDEWVRTTAFSQLAAWRSNGGPRVVERIAVNVTARELATSDFASRLASSLQDTGLDGRDLAVEVTEHVLLQTSHSAVGSLSELRSLGVRVGLDDFGTGFSALSYLQTFPLDYLKIDRSLVERITVDARSSAIISATIDLAHALDLAVVAEGVETEEQVAMLRSFGCDRGQGFVFSRPVSATDFAERLDGQPGAVMAPVVSLNAPGEAHVLHARFGGG